MEKLKINPDKKENSRDKDILVSAIKKVLSEDKNIKDLSSDELINYVNVLNDPKITFAINKEFNKLYEDVRKQEEEKRIQEAEQKLKETESRIQIQSNIQSNVSNKLVSRETKTRIKESLIENCFITEETARAIVIAIIENKIPHVGIIG